MARQPALASRLELSRQADEFDVSTLTLEELRGAGR